MTSQHIRRALALVTAAALLASLAVATIASPAAAAKPRCQGKTATIVGTKKADVIRGTAGRDVIVAKGGNDRIYGRGGDDLICAGGGNDTVYGGRGADRALGQLGRDRLFGNAGPDFLSGQVGNDTLVGGVGVDTCYQGTGSGLVRTCERPAAPIVPTPAPAPAPTPPPAYGPTPVPLDGILAVAYTDMNGNDGYDVDDVLIAQLVDEDADGIPSKGDTVQMGRYPLDIAASDHGVFRATGHTVDTVTSKTSEIAKVYDDAGADWTWRTASSGWEAFQEHLASPTRYVYAEDVPGAGDLDSVRADLGAPSDPDTHVVSTSGAGTGNDPFIDVLLNY